MMALTEMSRMALTKFTKITKERGTGSRTHRMALTKTTKITKERGMGRRTYRMALTKLTKTTKERGTDNGVIGWLSQSSQRSQR